MREINNIGRAILFLNGIDNFKLWNLESTTQILKENFEGWTISNISASKITTGTISAIKTGTISAIKSGSIILYKEGEEEVKHGNASTTTGTVIHS